MDGKDYRARVRLSAKDDETLALPGETCERVSVSSLADLLASGKIEHLPSPQADGDNGETIEPEAAV